MKTTVRIGIVGDYNPANWTLGAADTAIQQASAVLELKATSQWLATDSILDSGWESTLASFDALLCAPGSPYRSMEGALRTIRWARENGRPFLGTCGGFQHAVIEYARSVLGLPDAEHEETNPTATTHFISRMACSLQGRSEEVRIQPGTTLFRAMGTERSTEQFYCSFGVNPKFAGALEDGRMRVSARSREGQIRAVELAGHPFFLGTHFIPQLTSSPGQPHPVISALLKAACG